jgi:CubicO group peptidase (beta-lactamase class C family)
LYALLAAPDTFPGFSSLVTPILPLLIQPVSSGLDAVLHQPMAFSHGMMKDPVDPVTGQKLRRLFGPSLQAFGHPGAGGSLCFADPENRIAFAYVMNQMEVGVLPSSKALGLVDRLYGLAS